MKLKDILSTKQTDKHCRQNSTFFRERYVKRSYQLLKITFDLLIKSLDCRMKELTNIGIGTKINRADPAFIQYDEQLWKSTV